MKTKTVLLTLVVPLCLIIGACASPSPTPFDVPTLAALPTETDTATTTPTHTPSFTPTLTTEASQPPTLTHSATHTPSATFTLPATATDTLTPSYTPTVTVTVTPTSTLTPSLTITKTITPTLTNTPTHSPEPGLASLAFLAGQVTIAPYPPPTQTALAIAAEQLRQSTLAAGLGSTPTPVTGAVGGGTPGVVVLTSPPVVTLATLPPAICTTQPPGGLAGMLNADPVFAPLMGCPSGSFAQIAAAYQPFERGVMIYVQGTPGLIYALTNDGRLRRFNDNWISGVDPDSGGLTPPPNLLEPIRGFGKVWRENLDLQTALGWATAGESGMTATMQMFDRGRALYLPAPTLTYLLAEDVPFTGSGSWRSFGGGF